jgi:hypothetical protein
MVVAEMSRCTTGNYHCATRRKGFMVKILVCGSRDWDDEDIVHRILDSYITEENLTIIDGMAKGTDTFGYNWANEHADYDVKSERYPADWETYGKRAGYLRNVQMLEEGKPDLVLAFTDDLVESRGTSMMVQLATDAGVPVYVIGRG